ncbi:unnamed protein product [Gongylonema pulchrum]|uniref:Myosin motor domain-containing protein n=1 Tax=Gongylonema pulchrum TaxID=637853 RepID=A0A183ELM4_9BILA|nr:unnamed protein product [Gongylonema pulchrum]
MYEDGKIAAASMNKNERLKQSLHYMRPVHSNLRERYPNATNENTYVTQEVRMLVGVASNDTFKRVRYTSRNVS